MIMGNYGAVIGWEPPKSRELMIMGHYGAVIGWEPPKHGNADRAHPKTREFCSQSQRLIFP